MTYKTILFFALIFSVGMAAQKQQDTPYSFFGVGTLFQAKTIEESMMGGIGTAISDPVHLNFSNPASLSGLRFTNFSVGVVNSQTTISDAEVQQKTSVFSIPYVALGIPLGNKAGFTTGFRAKTAVGYALTDGDIASDEGLYTYEGNGGSNSLFFSMGVRVFKGLSVGIEGAYVFGDLENTITHQQNEILYDTREKTTAVLRGFDTKLGLHYQGKVSKKQVYNLGMTFLKSKELKVTETSSFYSGFFSADFESVKNTLAPVTKEGSINNPLNTTLAIGYGELTKWYASIEYSFNDAVTYNGSTLQNNVRQLKFDNYQRISLGGYFIPKYNSLSSYFSRVVYRAGIKYENSGMYLDGTEITDFGMSFGIGLPMGKGLSDLNIGVEYGIKGEVTDTLVEEKYINLKLSLSLGDKWFRKRKID